jgi:hypothetical protein
MENYFYYFAGCCIVLCITLFIVSMCISKIVHNVRNISVEEFETFKQIVNENRERSISNKKAIEKALTKKKN